MSAGQVVGGRWQLGQELGHGAFGQVFSAEDRSAVSLGQAAIKVLHPSTSPRERAGFHDEIRKVVALRHQNLVAYLDSGEYIDEEGSAHLYLVTELCQYSLQDWLDRTPGGLAPDQAERLLNDVSAGLGYLHGRGTLHRDLKPGNVLLGGTDWKLADFGLSRDLSATGHYHHGDQLMGTPRYMAPELFERGAAAPAADVYAVGVTLHQALTGRLVHEASSEVALIVAITTQPPAIDPSLPPEWRHLIGRCLDRDPARRPAAAELPAVLAAGRAGSGGVANATVAVGHQFTPGGPYPPSGPAAGAATLGAAAGLAGGQFTPGGPLAGGQFTPGGPHAAPGVPNGSDGFTRPVPFQASPRTGPSRGLIAGVLAAVAAVVVVGGIVALANRGGGDETATPDTVLSGAAAIGNGAASSSTTTGAAGGAGTTPDPAAVAAAAQQKVAAITPGQADAPTGYTTTLDPDGSPELCTGIQPLRLARPPWPSRAWPTTRRPRASSSGRWPTTRWSRPRPPTTTPPGWPPPATASRWGPTYPGRCGTSPPTPTWWCRWPSNRRAPSTRPWAGR
ncbi:MAG: serine/threonine-protein kinase [Acidimicrobiales bacterium]